MANVLDVARYVVENASSLTAMKLEKLVYYCQAWSLAWDGVPLFNEDFEAWANGPVCPDLYHQHAHQFRISEDFLSDHSDAKFTQDQLDTMNAVIDHYDKHDARYLSELTHKERPWKEARNGLPLGESSSETISKEVMADYYGGIAVQ